MKDSVSTQDTNGSVESERQDSERGTTSKSPNPNLKDSGIALPIEPGVIAGETVEQVGASSAFFVGAGILISRIVGLIRQRIFAHYFGSSGVADAFTAAFRIPNFLQNVFGEGALSASFIPVYAKLLAQGDEKE